ncbi:hypothetical protein [Streptomyces dioscori]|uniref:hypothetical protein n=1 Tax=Streptomyces dioscori TaxID=2109333 RepID=UPI0018FE324F|nr:hypothetical protein [Streptomyces dioscori]
MRPNTRNGPTAGGVGPSPESTDRWPERAQGRRLPVAPGLQALLVDRLDAGEQPPEEEDRPRAQQVFVQIYDRLGPLAELHFRQILATVSPELAELASHHDSAAIAELYASLGDRRAHGDTPFEQAARARKLEEVKRSKP